MHPATSPTSAGGCTCTSASCVSANGDINREACLDDVATREAIDMLAAKGIRTIVVGFGADVDNPEGVRALNALAVAGGFARACKSDAQCGPDDTCDLEAKLCGRRFYQARNGSELGASLDAIVRQLPVSDPCRFELGSPTNPALISVEVADQPLPPGEQTWGYDQSGTQPAVRLLGSTCGQILSANPASKILVKVRVGRVL